MKTLADVIDHLTSMGFFAKEREAFGGSIQVSSTSRYEDVGETSILVLDDNIWLQHRGDFWFIHDEYDQKVSEGYETLERLALAAEEHLKKRVNNKNLFGRINDQD